MKSIIFAALLVVAGPIAWADSPVVERARAHKTAAGWQFDVTLRHADTGWDHYANGWGIYSVDGNELGYRVLLHPHVNEQPFTRSLSGIAVPNGTATVIIIPNDLVHGTGKPFAVDLK